MTSSHGVTIWIVKMELEHYIFAPGCPDGVNQFMQEHEVGKVYLADFPWMNQGFNWSKKKLSMEKMSCRSEQCHVAECWSHVTLLFFDSS